MEDYSTILLIIAAVTVSIIQEFRKQSKARQQKAAGQSATPSAKQETVWEEQEEEPLRPSPFLAGEGRMATTRPHTARHQRTERPAATETPPPPQEANPRTLIDTDLEEVRRGILWSEILHRKY